MKNRKSQVALVTVMILATVLTVVLSASFRSVVNTQTSKLEEENQKALAAAEAAVEAALNTGGTVQIGVDSLANIQGYVGNASVTSIATNDFKTALIDINNQYTFYLTEYDPASNQFQGTSSNQEVEICFEDGSALEIALIKTDSIKRYAVNSPSLTPGINSADPSTSCIDGSPGYRISAGDISTDSKLLIVKVLFRSSALNFIGGNDFPHQGVSVTSEATSATSNVSKKIELFRTHPQIPSDFFDTSFYLPEP